MKRGAFILSRLFQQPKCRLIGEDIHGNKYYDNGYKNVPQN